jgi:hypothetical protein
MRRHISNTLYVKYTIHMQKKRLIYFTLCVLSIVQKLTSTLNKNNQIKSLTYFIYQGKLYYALP